MRIRSEAASTAPPAPSTVSRATTPLTDTKEESGLIGPTLAARSDLNFSWPLGLTSAVTAALTCCRVGEFRNLTEYSVPPAKSMPSRKPLLAIETRPGMMIRREIAKNQLRRPTMSRRRSRGRASSASGATAPSCSLSSATLDSHQSGIAAHAGQGQDQGQQVVGDDDGRDQADGDADQQRRGEALDLSGAQQQEHEAGDHR